MFNPLKLRIMARTISVRLKGSSYSFNTYCYTLKEAMETYPSCAKRSNIAEWWYN